MVTKELFKRFLQGECTEEEHKRIVRYLEDHPEAVEQLMPEEEFLNNENEGDFPPHVRNRITEKVKKKTYGKTSVRQLGKRLLIAASFILVIVSVWRFIVNDNSSTLVVKEPATRQDTVWSKLVATATNLRVVLPDSSLITLSPNSTIQYNNFFQANGKRMIYLSGEAYFKVSKDTAKPFVVYTGDIATRALGTSFTIHAHDEKNIISVLLHTGKVVVQSADSGNIKLTDAMYLLPGDELFYNKRTYLASIRSQKSINRKPANRNTTEQALIYKPEWYKFNDQQLNEVLDQLSFYYQVNIDYKEADIRNCYITAKFNNQDSLDAILHDIALLNLLTIDKRNNQYIIRKVKP